MLRVLSLRFVRFAAVAFICLVCCCSCQFLLFAKMFAVVRDNEFLKDHTHDANCFCEPCRKGHARMFAQTMPFVYLRHQVQVALPNLRKQQTNITFETTKRQVLLGKVFHDMCLSPPHNPRRYVRFTWWAKKDPYYRVYAEHPDRQRQKDFRAFCSYITACATVFNKWDIICNNLRNERITHVDVRSLGVETLKRCVTLHWCIEYNTKLSSGERKRQGGDDANYSQADIDNIFQYMLSTGVLQNASVSEASSIGQQLERKCVSYAMRHNPPLVIS